MSLKRKASSELIASARKKLVPFSVSPMVAVAPLDMTSAERDEADVWARKNVPTLVKLATSTTHFRRSNTTSYSGKKKSSHILRVARSIRSDLITCYHVIAHKYNLTLGETLFPVQDGLVVVVDGVRVSIDLTQKQCRIVHDASGAVEDDLSGEHEKKKYLESVTARDLSHLILLSSN